MQDFIDNHGLILMEAAIVEPIRRAGRVTLDPLLVNAPLIYEQAGRKELTDLYLRYQQVAADANVPFMMCGPTWRTNAERVAESNIDKQINIHAVEFMRELIESRGLNSHHVKVGGMVGCKNDCYQPGEALTSTQAEQFHAWQINQLATAGVDFLQAVTLPSVEEAIGIARAMAATDRDYLISFVINRSGQVLDRTPLNQAIERIDSQVERAPLGYMVNCAHPSFLSSYTPLAESRNRLVGFQGNASALDHAELDCSERLQVDDVEQWGKDMLRLHAEFGVKILGGCCGTGEEHLRYLTEHLASS